MEIYYKTDIGLERTENQDNVWGEMLTPNACAAVLCDGMGGESRGGFASRLAVETVSKRIKSNFNESLSKNAIRNMLITAVIAANSVVRDCPKESENEIMGTTCVAAIVFNHTAHIVNVGDSRAYQLFTDGDDECIRQITRDHSHVRELVEKGIITEEEAKVHPKRSKITRAIGAEDDVTPDYFELDLNKYDMLLLCSDGLSSYGDDLDILDICFDSKPKDCCEALVEYANQNGGHDNVSVAFISV